MNDTFCPAVCTEQLYISVVILGIVFGLIALLLFIFRKKYSSKAFRILFYFSIVMFILFSIQIKYTACGSGCDGSGTFFNINLLPTQLLPYVPK